jgi:hypothetical protein
MKPRTPAFTMMTRLLARAKNSPVNGTSATMSTGISEPMSGW